VTPKPMWNGAVPLSGCDVIRPPTTPLARPPPQNLRPAVVTKILALNQFLDRTARELHPSAALVWVLLLRDERSGTARTAVSDLARRAGVSERTVKRHLSALKACGLLEVVKAGKPDAGPTVYKLRAMSRIRTG